MTLAIRTDARASAELVEAVRWYESKRRGLGGELLDEVAETIDRLALNAEVGSPLSADHRTRRLLVSRFPYQIIYRVRPHEIIVVALAHLKRRPGYWKGRQ